MATRTVIEAIREAMDEEMARDPSVFLIGEDVGQRGGVFIGLDEYLRSVAADDSEERVSIRLLEPYLKAKLVAVKTAGLIDIADDEEW